MALSVWRSLIKLPPPHPQGTPGLPPPPAPPCGPPSAGLEAASPVNTSFPTGTKCSLPPAPGAAPTSGVLSALPATWWSVVSACDLLPSRSESQWEPLGAVVRWQRCVVSGEVADHSLPRAALCTSRSPQRHLHPTPSSCREGGGAEIRAWQATSHTTDVWSPALDAGRVGGGG